ncbi:MAG TPA: methyltransferase domain-containing protein [Phycisphaerae bacterium]|nr:methyltransferase domain-containing protein [Phycisphaerae bacterium]
MNPEAMQPFGKALLAYFEGDTAAELTIRRDDGRETPLPVSWFFRDASRFTPVDRAALEHCAGRVLDAGAGTGLHSLVLQQRGLRVVAIDVSPHAVTVMKRRGLTEVRSADVLEFQGGPFDTLLMMGHGIGMVETIDGLDRFLAHARSLIAENGQILLDSMDVRVTDDAGNLAYQEANRKAGRYIGEIRMQFEFRRQQGPVCGWLQVDSDTLTDHSALAGWRCAIIHRETDGNYLARLTQRRRP